MEGLERSSECGIRAKSVTNPRFNNIRTILFIELCWPLKTWKWKDVFHHMTDNLQVEPIIMNMNYCWNQSSEVYDLSIVHADALSPSKKIHHFATVISRKIRWIFSYCFICIFTLCNIQFTENTKVNGLPDWVPVRVSDKLLSQYL